MYMIIHLFQEKYLQDVILALSEAGIDNCVVLQGESLGHKLVYDIPLFSTFKDTFGSSRDYSNVIMGTAEKEEINFFLKEMRLSGADFIKENLGKIYLIPITETIE